MSSPAGSSLVTTSRAMYLDKKATTLQVLALSVKCSCCVSPVTPHITHLRRLLEVCALEMIRPFANAVAEEEATTLETLDTQVGVAVLQNAVT